MRMKNKNKKRKREDDIDKNRLLIADDLVFIIYDRVQLTIMS